MARGPPRAQPECGAMLEYLKGICNLIIPYVPPATTKRFIVLSLSLSFLYAIERSIVLLLSLHTIKQSITISLLLYCIEKKSKIRMM